MLKPLPRTVASIGAFGVLGLGLLVPAARVPVGAVDEGSRCNGLEVTLASSSPVIEGTAGADVIQVVGTRGHLVRAGDGDDTVCGSPGADVIEGGPGDDTLFGMAGRDDLSGGPGTDTLVQGAPTTSDDA